MPCVEVHWEVNWYNFTKRQLGNNNRMQVLATKGFFLSGR